ncbi:MAG: caspase family protein [Neomegalonema sp.]|nr:caspase family protein [Neomegalonema sp.]
MTYSRSMWAAALLALLSLSLQAEARDRALLIGITDYQVKKLSLKGADADLDTMLRVAQGPLGIAPGDVRILRDDEATKAGIIATFEDWLVKGTKPGDRVFISYSGHGTQIRDLDGDERDGLDEALAPWDARTDGSNLITDDEFSALLRKLPGRKIILLIDACNSGTITRRFGRRAGAARKGERYFQVTGKMGAPAPVRAWAARALSDHGFDDQTRDLDIVSFTAAAAYQLTYEAEINGREQGIFSFVIGELLQKKPNATHAEILTHLRRRMAKICRGVPACKLGNRGRPPTPQMRASPATVLGLPFGRWRPQKAKPSPEELVVATLPAASDGATLEILPRPRLRYPEEVRFRVTSPVKGQIILFDVADDGETSILWPLPGREEVLSSPVRAVTFPDEDSGRAIQPTPGASGAVFALIAEDEVGLQALIERFHARKKFTLIEFVAAVSALFGEAVKGDKPSAQAASRGLFRELRTPRWRMVRARYRVD